MAIRDKIWITGVVFSTLVAIGIGLEESSLNLVLPVAFLSIGLTAWIAEVTSLRSSYRKSLHPRTREGSRPADGIVEVATTSGVESEPNSIQTSYRRFVGLSDGTANLPSTAEPSSYLLGRIVMVSAFVGRDGVGWSDQEIVDGLDSVRSAALWIEREAIRYDAPVNIALADVYFSILDDVEDLVEISFQPEGDDFGPMEANSSTKALVRSSRLASKLGFVDVADWMNRINTRLEADVTVWMFHLRSAGRSMAIGAGLSGVREVAFALCYAEEASFPEPLAGRPRVDPTTVAHEMLHQFGASDKYGIALNSFPKRSVTSGDIMRLNFDSLRRMRIDPLTAEEIGWAGSDWLENVTKKPQVAWMGGDRRQVDGIEREPK